MIDALARVKPAYQPGTAVGYHALTFGWLVVRSYGESRACRSRSSFRPRLAKPLGLDGLHIGCPPEQRHRMAPLAPMSKAFKRLSDRRQLPVNLVTRGLHLLRSPINPHRMINAALSRGMEEVIADPRLSTPPFRR